MLLERVTVVIPGAEQTISQDGGDQLVRMVGHGGDPGSGADKLSGWWQLERVTVVIPGAEQTISQDGG